MRTLGNIGSVLSLALPAFYVFFWLTYSHEDWQTLLSDAPFAVALTCIGAMVLVFWLWMVQTYWRHRPEDHRFWGLALIFGAHISAAFYYLIVHQRRLAHSRDNFEETE